MSRFFTSDWHLGSTNILEYSSRPFKTAGEAASGLVDACNDVAHKADVVFHVGDFWLSGVDRHGKTPDENALTADPDDYLRFISARFVLLSGNHDDGHNVESDLKSMTVDLNRNYRDVHVSHYPSTHGMYGGPRGGRTKRTRIALCGHVHDRWLLCYDAANGVLNVNVGVDVWDYRPVRDSQITELLDFVLKFDIFDRTWAWNRRDLNMYIEAWKHQLELGRTARKNERYARKGLTPEECERRRAEALARKGIKPRAEKRPAESGFAHEDAVQFGIVPPDVCECDGMSV